MRFLLVLSLCISSAAFGDERTDAQKHYVQGTKAFDLGAYDEAIAEYSTAYRLRPDPALLYNLGQAHRLANHPTDAIHFYRMYLSKVPNAPNRDEVTTKLDELQRQLEQQRAAEQQKREEERRAAAAQQAGQSPQPTSTPSVTPANVVAPAEVVDHKSGRTTMIAGAAVTGLGVAALAGGISCGILAKQNSDALTRAAQMMQPFDSGKQSAGKAEQSAEIALLAIGGAAVVTGVVLLLVGRAHQHHGARAQLTPLIGAHAAGALTAVQF